MARPKKHYTDLPKLHWKDLSSSSWVPGLLTIKPHAEMMGDGGAIRYITNEKENIRQPVILDKEYVLDYFHRRLVVNMGFYQDGILEKDILKAFMLEILKYSKQKAVEHEDGLLRKDAAGLAARYPGKTEEEWYQSLRKDAKKYSTSNDQDTVSTET